MHLQVQPVEEAEVTLADFAGLLTEAEADELAVGTAHVYARVRNQLKTAGTPLPENDVWIAALCVQHRLTLLTLDQHFEKIEGLSLAR